MNTNRMTLAGALLACAACLGALSGCGQSDKDNTGVGPAQQAGKALDDAGAKASAKVQEEVGKADAAAARARDAAPDAVEQARRNPDQVTDKVGKKVEQAGQKMQQAADK